MADPTWITYTGAIGGIIGTITGVAGCIMGYISYRRSEAFKALDLRIELKKTEADLHSIASGLPQLIQRAQNSRSRVAAAAGQHGSGAMVRWRSMWEADSAESNAIIERLPDLKSNYQELTHEQLESRLVKAHTELLSARQLKEKYDAEIEKDDKERERIKAAMHSRT